MGANSVLTSDNHGNRCTKLGIKRKNVAKGIQALAFDGRGGSQGKRRLCIAWLAKRHDEAEKPRHDMEATSICLRGGPIASTGLYDLVEHRLDRITDAITVRCPVKLASSPFSYSTVDRSTIGTVLQDQKLASFRFLSGPSWTSLVSALYRSIALDLPSSRNPISAPHTCSCTMAAPSDKMNSKDMDTTHRSSVAWYLKAFMWFFVMPSAIITFTMTVLDHNGTLDTIPMIEILRLFRMSHIIMAVGYLVVCFVVLPIVAARMS